MMKKAYLAGPIFTEKDKMFLDYLAKNIREICHDIDLYVPHENTEINDKKNLLIQKISIMMI